MRKAAIGQKNIIDAKNRVEDLHADEQGNWDKFAQQADMHKGFGEIRVGDPDKIRQKIEVGHKTGELAVSNANHQDGPVIKAPTAHEVVNWDKPASLTPITPADPFITSTRR